MPFDTSKAAESITKKGFVLPPYGNRQCASHVRKALEDGGLNTAGHPIAAKDWGPTLVRIGFRTIAASASYYPQTGDVIVFPSIKGHPDRHIQLCDGKNKNWVSDFIQPDMYPHHAYRAEKAKYEIYRFGF